MAILKISSKKVIMNEKDTLVTRDKGKFAENFLSINASNEIHRAV